MKKIIKKAEMGMMQNKPTPGSINGQRGLPLDKKIQEGIKSGKLHKDGTTKNPFPKKKMGGAMKKAKVGGEFGALSVKAGVDDNYGITAADRIAGATKGKAKLGAKMKMGGAMAKQAAVAIAMKKAGKAPKKKMQYGGEAASMVPPAMMKKGGAMKKCKYGCK